jgi:hypothetical protein
MSDDEQENKQGIGEQEPVAPPPVSPLPPPPLPGSNMEDLYLTSELRESDWTNIYLDNHEQE